MQPLKDYLNESPLSEGILDRDQNKVLGRMTDEMIRQRIIEYCQDELNKYKPSKLWPLNAKEAIKILEVDKDRQGWYILTTGHLHITDIDPSIKSLYDLYRSKGYKIDEQKGFLIEDIGVYFQWSEHFGVISITRAQNFESTKGLPDWQSVLILRNCCKKSKRLDVCNNIWSCLSLANMGDIKITGKGLKNIMINPDSPCGDVTAPRGVKIYRPKDSNEFEIIAAKLAEP